MSHVTGLQCVHCGREYEREEVEYYCPACGYHDGILDVLYDYEAVREELNADVARRQPRICPCGAICLCCRSQRRN